MQIFDYRYLEKVFENLQKKLYLAEDAPSIGIKIVEDQRIDLGTYVDNNESRHSHGKNDNDFWEVSRDTNFEELQGVFHITQKLMLHHQVEILNVKTIEWTSPS